MECPNCGKPVDESAPLCPHCGYDIHSEQAAEVRQLREEGRIEPGRIGAENQDFRGGDPREPDEHEELPAEDYGPARGDEPEQQDAGL